MQDIGNPPSKNVQDFGDFRSKKMMDLICARWTSQALTVAAELGVADHLKDGPLSAEDLAARTQTHAASLFRVLRALASEGIFEQLEDQRFKLTSLGETLRSDFPGSSRRLATFLGTSWLNQSWDQMMHSVRTGSSGVSKVYGKSFYEYIDEHPDQAAEFSEAMTGAAHMMHTAAIAAYDFSGIGTLADLGGGYGYLLGSLLRKYPSMKGILFDQPGIVPHATKNFEAMGVRDRCSLVGGDFFESVPGGADAYVISNVLHCFLDPDALKMFKNIRAATRPGVKLIVMDGVIEPGNEPDFGKLLDLHMLVALGGKERTAAEFEKLYSDTGFKVTRILPTKSSVTIVEGVAV